MRDVANYLRIGIVRNFAEIPIQLILRRNKFNCAEWLIPDLRCYWLTDKIVKLRIWQPRAASQVYLCEPVWLKFAFVFKYSLSEADLWSGVSKCPNKIGRGSHLCETRDSSRTIRDTQDGRCDRSSINFSRKRRASAIDPQDPYPSQVRSGNELSQVAKRLSPAAKLAQECVPAFPLFFPSLLSFSRNRGVNNERGIHGHKMPARKRVECRQKCRSTAGRNRDPCLTCTNLLVSSFCVCIRNGLSAISRLRRDNWKKKKKQENKKEHAESVICIGAVVLQCKKRKWMYSTHWWCRYLVVRILWWYEYPSSSGILQITWVLRQFLAASAWVLWAPECQEISLEHLDQKPEYSVIKRYLNTE